MNRGGPRSLLLKERKQNKKKKEKKKFEERKENEREVKLADSNFLYQLCTCVYYSYIDSMMLFCGALHVSIGLCMSYRAS